MYNCIIVHMYNTYVHMYICIIVQTYILINIMFTKKTLVSFHNLQACEAKSI